MAKIIRYIGCGIFIAYALHGGCDRNIDEVFREAYSRPIIETRKSASEFILEKSGEIYKAIGKDLESRMDGRAVRGGLQ